MKKWYCVPHLNEIGCYHEEGELTDFDRGTFLAYGGCCLTVGFKTEEEAKQWIEKYPCDKVKR